MDIITSQAMDEINLAIGRAVSSLISSGQNVEKQNILEQLRKSEEEAVDGMKEIYAGAIGMVTGKTPVRID
ncbi:MAG: hypothetical protein E6559_07325 [Pantoea sp.]|uniref:hypothetical protein n=1 Tax=Pantoea septica TaxID=472695 RepID=UPI000E8E114D|nr:hypothetical protein [Pantoea septica]MBU5379418.1 hypothetical protein [Pantoea septica]MDU5838479.1 hypothetical protein [Pantoea sp.]MDU6439716.1 hypothetical protein [Pantoea sp.]HAT23557.1 hypothetical protein [Pantoea septica]